MFVFFSDISCTESLCAWNRTAHSLTFDTAEFDVVRAWTLWNHGGVRYSQELSSISQWIHTVVPSHDPVQMEKDCNLIRILRAFSRGEHMPVKTRQKVDWCYQQTLCLFFGHGTGSSRLTFAQITCFLNSLIWEAETRATTTDYFHYQSILCRIYKMSENCEKK